MPTSTVDDSYDFTIELDGTEFKLSFFFNRRDDAWNLTIYKPDDTVLRAGLKVVNEWALLRLWVSADRPLGELLTVNQGELTEPPLENQLGEEALLDYLDEQEIIDLG
jgi:hypothetical protein